MEASPHKPRNPPFSEIQNMSAAKTEAALPGCFLKSGITYLQGVRMTSYSGLKYRLETASRIFLAIVGGYILSAFAAIWITRLVPFEARYASITGNMLFFIIYTCAVIWTFANIKTIKAWLGICIPAAVLGGLLLLPWSGQ